MMSLIVGIIFLSISLVIIANFVMAINPNLAKFLGSTKEKVEKSKEDISSMPKTAVQVSLVIVVVFLLISLSISYIAFMDAFK